MPDKGQELFEIMDAALKRQREGLGAAMKRQGVPAVRPEGAAAPRRAEPAIAQPGPVPSGPAPVATFQAVQPSAGAGYSLDGAAAAGPHGAERWEVAAGQQPAPGQHPQGGSSGYSERLSRVLDSARSAPPAGSLTPGEVLRGTVFGRSRTEMQDEAVPPEPPPEIPPRTMSVRGGVSAVYRTPAAGAPASSGRALSGVLRPAYGGPMPAGAGGQLQQPGASSGRVVQAAAPLSQRGPAAAPAAARGILVPIEVAVLGMIGFVVLWIVAFFLGISHGREQSRTTSVRDVSDVKPPPGPVGPEGIKTVDPAGIKIQDPGDRPKPPAGDRQVAPPPSAGTGKWTVEVLRYPAGGKGSAEAMVRKLNEKGFQGVEIIPKTVRGNPELAVCVGRFESRDDPRAEQTKQAVIALDRRRYTALVEIVKVD